MTRTTLHRILVTMAGLASLGNGIAQAAEPRLVADLRPTGTDGFAFPDTVGLVAGGLYVFPGHDAAHGVEPWVSDGTVAGTRLLKDVNPGPSSSGFGEVWSRTFGNLLLFRAHDGFGSELWRTDGTAAGTFRLTDGHPGYDTPTMWGIGVGDNYAVFSMSDPIHGGELWRTDGTVTGTYLLKDIVPGTGGSVGADFTTSGGPIVYFRGFTPTAGYELWRTDGTADGTWQVLDLEAGTGSSSPSEMTIWQGHVYFKAYTTANGVELWKSNGTLGNATLVKEIRAGQNSASITTLRATPNRLFFTASVDGSNMQVWSTDGTAAGTIQVSSVLHTGVYLPIVGDRAYFPGTTTADGNELYVTDGTVVGTSRVSDINPGPLHANVAQGPTGGAAVGSLLVFGGENQTVGNELFVTDGTLGGTALLGDLIPGTASSMPTAFRSYAGGAFFSAMAPSGNRELWFTDGTTAGTRVVGAYAPDASARPRSVTALGDGVVFEAWTASGLEPWVSDGTSEGTIQLADTNPGPAHGDLSHVVRAGAQVYFQTTVDGDTRRLWVTDGTPTGTLQVTDLTLRGEAQYRGAPIGNLFLFPGDDGVVGNELWVTDGTPVGTSLVMDINSTPATGGGGGALCVEYSGLPPFFADQCCDFNPEFCSLPVEEQCEMVYGIPSFACCDVTGACPTTGPSNGTEPSDPVSFMAMDGYVLFAAQDGSGSAFLWRSDGTAGGTSVLLALPSTSSNPTTEWGRLGNVAIFATPGPGGYEIWRSDGTPAGTFSLAEAGSSPPLPAAAGALVYFTVASNADVELWATDGSVAGTRLVKDILPGPGGSAPAGFTGFGDDVIFTALSPDGVGRVLYRSNGTALGTNPIRSDLVVSTDGMIVVADGTIYFSATDGIHGVELWQSDGTAAGTMLVADINPGLYASTPTEGAVAGEQLFFSALTTEGGRELWVLPLAAVACTPCEAGSYETSQCTAENDRTCAPCSTCNAGTYADGGCDGTVDTVCATCSTCSAGTYPDGGCDGTVDTLCATCSTCSAGTYPDGGCDGTVDTACATCSTCGAGTYPNGGCDGTIDTMCAPCSTCSPGTYPNGGCDGTGDTMCAPCSTCSAGTYPDGGCDGTVDTVCATCSGACASGSFESEACDTTGDRECTPCATCAPDEVISAACDATHDTVCVAEGECGANGCVTPVFYGVVTNAAGDAIGSFRCERRSATLVVCDTLEDQRTLKVYPDLMCGP